MEKPRPIIAIVLSMAIILIYYTWINPPKPVQTVTKPVSTNQEQGTNSQLPVTVSSEQHQGLNISSPPESVNSLSPVTSQRNEEKSITLENEAIHASVSSQDGVIWSWKLKNFHEDVSDESPLIDFFNTEKIGEALVLTMGYPEFDKNVQFTVLDHSVNEGIETIVFGWSTHDLSIKKVISLGSIGDPHHVDVLIEVMNQSDHEILLEPRLWITKKQKENQKKGGFFSFLRGPTDIFTHMTFLDGKLEADGKNFEKLVEKAQKNGKIYWSGLTDRYFLMSFIARQGSEDVSVQYGKIHGDSIYTSLSYGQLNLQPGESSKKRYSAYLGPKKRDELKTMGIHLEASVDYGWFSFVAIPLLWLLIFFHKLVGNWGVAIIILTFFVKLLLHPINKKSMLSMKAMQNVSPQLKEIREKYKDNKEKLNMEMMQLFKTHKVNPMSGCLPMLLQIPVYFALYRVLWNSIELYHAPFFWFYKDLAAPDPYMISPILLGIFFFLQQKLTPQAATMDPAQQKVMMFMPIMFAGFMFFLPAGLVIYICVNTIMSVIQQYMIHREMNFLDLLRRLKILPSQS